jgi:hypothetical protein
MPPLARQRDQVTDIPRHHLPAYRIAKGFVQDLMEIANTAWLPSLTELFGIQLLYVSGSQLLELDMTYRRQNMVGQEKFLLQVARGENRLFQNVLKPFLQLVPGRLVRCGHERTLSSVTLHLLQNVYASRCDFP